MKQHEHNQMKFLKSESFRALLITCAGCVALVMGEYCGVFVIVWTEWAAILGGLMLAGSVFMFKSAGALIQCLRVLLFVAGFSLAGAGTTDLLNFPKSNADVYPGLMAGIVLGLILSRVIWGAGLHISDRKIVERFEIDGIGIPSAISMLIVALIALLASVPDGSSGTTGDIIKSVLMLSGLIMQAGWIKRRGDNLSRPAIWISFLSALIFSMALLIYLSVWSALPVELLVLLFVVQSAALILWMQRFVHADPIAPDPSDFGNRMLQFLTKSGVLVGVLLLSGVYYLILSQLVDNAIATALVAKNEAIFKLKDEKFVRLMMNDIYYARPLRNVYWADKDTPESFMEKFSTDTWTFATTYKSESEWDEGVSQGRGITPVIRPNKKVIGYIDHDSPAARAGYERGDEIVRYADTVAGYPQVFIRKPSGALIPNTIKPERHQVDTVMHKVIRQNGEIIGYLWLKDFISAAEEPLRNAFGEFKQAGVTIMVLDLRYNGGGNANSLLASLIAGADHAGQVYFRSKHSEKYRDRDEDTKLSREPNSIQTKRLFVLTTEDTCSASELVINGLRPYIPVITIGDTTCGKTYFMYPIAYHGYVYYPVSGRTNNSEGRSDYEGGIKPTCRVEETFDHPVDQPGDALLDAALFYQKNNACPVPS